MVPRPVTAKASSVTKAVTGKPSINPQVFLDIKIGETPAGRLNIELFANDVPKTAENFRRLCLGNYATSQGYCLSYKNTQFFTLIPGFVAIGGDIENDNGTGGRSVYGKYFDDEKSSTRHNRRGILSMMSFENGTNNSQFFITFGAAPHLDQYHVAFGRIISGWQVLDKIEACLTDAFRCPMDTIVISDCGELK